MNYGNSPVYALAPYMPRNLAPYYDAAIALFALWFFVSLHWRVHCMKHGFPPLYALWIMEQWRKFRGTDLVSK
jgi:hypothetical protein